MALTPEMPVREPKEMLSTRKLPDGRTEIRINNSSYSLISACKRKAHYALNRGLVSNHESEATLFGRAIHGALEVWYSSPRGARSKASAACDESLAAMEAGMPTTPHGRCVRCASQARFLDIAQPLVLLPSTEKRSLRSGTTLLDAYFDYYLDDPFVVLSDDLGPFAERGVSIVLADELDSRVTFFGTLDTVLKNEQTSHIVLMDHKTTSSLGISFISRINPNAQVVGYTAAFRRSYPQFDTRTFGINALQVAKTKQAFLRQEIEVSEEMIEEWRISMLDVAYDWWARLQAQGPYPMTTPDPCSMWGACQYLELCTTPAALRENIIQAHYQGTPT